MRTVLLVVLVVTLWPTGNVAAQVPGPDEVVLAYLRNAYAPIQVRPFQYPLWPDASYCRAYGLLSEPTRAVLSAVEFVASARQVSLVLGDVDLGEPQIEGDRATVRARIVLHSLYGRQTLTDFAHLLREPAGWRLVLSEDGVTWRKRAAQDYARRRAPEIPETVCG